MTHKNFMGSNAHGLSPIQTLRVAAASSFFGEPTYYNEGNPDPKAKKGQEAPRLIQASRYVSELNESLGGLGIPSFAGKTPAQRMEAVIDTALDHDPEATLQEAVILRNQGHIRTTPQVIMVRAAHHPKVRGTGLITRYAPHIMTRADEPGVQLRYHNAMSKEGAVPNSLKKAWASYLSKLTEYQASKYKGSGLVDVVNVCHPKGNPVLGSLIKGTLTQDDKTWEAIISKEGSNTQSWTKAVEVMGHMALLRNLRNLETNKVNPSLYLPKLIKTASQGKQLPFRYWSAFKAITNEATKDAVTECLKESLGFLPFFKGRVASLCDNSGSARGATTSALGTITINEIANLCAVLTGYQSDDGWIGCFGDRLDLYPVDKTKGPMEELAKANMHGSAVGQNTENGIWLFFDRAIQGKEHWDHIFVYSDMQAGHGGLYGTDPSKYKKYQWYNSRNIDVPKLIEAYRESVNPKVNVHLVQVAGYTDALVPENYYRTSIIGGWGEGIFNYAAQMASIFDGLDAQQA